MATEINDKEIARMRKDHPRNRWTTDINALLDEVERQAGAIAIAVDFEAGLKHLRDTAERERDIARAEIERLRADFSKTRDADLAFIAEANDLLWKAGFRANDTVTNTKAALDALTEARAQGAALRTDHVSARNALGHVKAYLEQRETALRLDPHAELKILDMVRHVLLDAPGALILDAPEQIVDGET